jgi:hypothetical protein
MFCYTTSILGLATGKIPTGNVSPYSSHLEKNSISVPVPCHRDVIFAIPDPDGDRGPDKIPIPNLYNIIIDQLKFIQSTQIYMIIVYEYTKSVIYAIITSNKTTKTVLNIWL